MRKAVACLLLLSFCVAVLPIPVPTFRVPESNSSERYPCKGGTCGCNSAEQCWTNCCCNTPAQRMAWAKKNQVTPPTYAVLEDIPPKEIDRIVPVPEKVLAMKREKSCCKNVSDKASPKNCCDERRSTELREGCKSCKSSTATQKIAKNPQSTPEEKTSIKKTRSFVASMLALKCQGADSVFTQLPWMLPSVRQQAIYVAHFEATLWPFARTLMSIDSEPDTPPPKRHFC